MGTGPGRRTPLSPGAPADGCDALRARRSRWASSGLVLVLLVVSVFAVWSSQVTARSAASAAAASRLSEDWSRAAGAVTAQEALQRKYGRANSRVIRARYDEATEELVTALRLVTRDGDAQDRATADEVTYAHQRYLGSIYRMFSALDLRDTATAMYIEDQEVEPEFRAIQRTVQRAARAQHDASLAQLAHLQGVSSASSRLTPGVFLVGLLLASLLTSVTRGERRMLDAQRRQAVHDSLHDALTGLPNRLLLATRFEQALRAPQPGTATQDGTATGLLLLDLDRFKEVNDTFGHSSGDALLLQVSARLRDALREGDTVARLGGDEFAVVLPQVSGVDGAVAAARTLRAALERPFLVEGVALEVEASVGVVVSGEHGTDASTLLQRADIAMYVAKAQGCGVFAYDPAVDDHSPARLALLGDLRRALDRGQLLLHYQPQVALATGEVVGAEALVRWQHPDRGLVPPDAFIPLAEASGLIGPLTTFVLDAALGQARAWADAGWGLPVSVNVSARNLLDEGLPQQVEELLARHGVPAALLELEVTESALVTEPERARRLLAALADRGVRLSVDDFGAGYTSLGQLQDLPVDAVKIDRSFVQTMTDGSSSSLIVRSVIELGHDLGLTVVAEGVETAEALETLRGYGCDTAQGYHLARPLPAAALEEWLAGRRVHSMHALGVT